MQKLAQPPAIIFTTAYDAYAIKAFEVHAIDYLLKPIRAARLLAALMRARAAAPPAARRCAAARPEPRRHLRSTSAARIHLVPVGEILYLKAELKYVTVAHRAQREYLSRSRSRSSRRSSRERFVRIHRNCLVARAAIRGFERVQDEGEGHWVVVLEGIEEKLAVSRRQHHIVREFAR